MTAIDASIALIANKYSIPLGLLQRDLADVAVGHNECHQARPSDYWLYLWSLSKWLTSIQAELQNASETVEQ